MLSEHREETKEKIGRANSKRVKHLKTGKVYANATRCSEETGDSKATISYHCTGRAVNPRYKFVEE